MNGLRRTVEKAGRKGFRFPFVNPLQDTGPIFLITLIHQRQVRSLGRGYLCVTISHYSRLIRYGKQYKFCGMCYRKN